MNFVNKSYIQTHEVKQSKFIAHFMPYSEYDFTLKELKLSHPKARHFVVAYRYLNEFNQIVEHSSDDGEPKGTSGKPTLMVLQGADIINSAVIIVRYFGGVKLGTGGLVRAYSDATNLVLSSSDLLEYKEEISQKISFEYSNIRMIEYECLTCNIKIVNKEFDEKTVYELKASKVDMECFLKKVERISSIYLEQHFPYPT
ncbi:MAG: YigZ family protein [Sulfurimonas sp.]|uniref:IMPACT family protein n=1 Tax=Sulfurimonas sp. TaxID=2022749 RepID=UPI002614F1A9|nr:YigZ family protein [Sulfurimonas sp.]MCW8894254.1 YigZ family protein [Sulfurimonas sp.]MCW8954005.1 YigZ family protein [Sulfurimonas sp.]MCW9067059.1 YigZ family protein [Sulfurimonas sp.]